MVADWDGDGRWDILTGAADGGVYWYQERRRAGPARLSGPGRSWSRSTRGSATARSSKPTTSRGPGIRSQIALADHDGDGKLDLLVGDFATNLHIRSGLTPDERRAFTEAARKQDEAARSLRAAMDKIRADFKVAMKGVPLSDWNTPENSAKWQASYHAMQASPDYKRHQRDYETAEAEIARYVDAGVPGKHLGKDPAISHGYVWLYRRR